VKAPWKDGNMTKYPVPNDEPIFDTTTTKRRLRINITKAEIVFPLFALAAPIVAYIVTVLT
jgi:hypothetical protein